MRILKVFLEGGKPGRGHPSKNLIWSNSARDVRSEPHPKNVALWKGNPFSFKKSRLVYDPAPRSNLYQESTFFHRPMICRTFFFARKIPGVIKRDHLLLVGGFKNFLFSPLFGEDSHFD